MPDSTKPAPDLAFTASEEEAGERLDKLVLAALTDFDYDYSRAQVQTMIKDGLITVDESLVKAGVKLRGTETVRIWLPVEPQVELKPEVIDLNVIYEDSEIAVINKPAGMVIHPGAGVASGTLVNGLLARYPEIAQMQDDELRHGIVHRLDKDTSGLIVIARNDLALEDLMAQFQERTVEKTYLTLVEREPKTVTGRIDAPIGRDPKQRKRMAVVRDGRPAITEFKVLDTNFRDGQALVELNLLTGRTHQIRVHMAFIGAPVVGDKVYGFRKQRIGMKRNFLHAAKLAFDHPQTTDRMTFETPLPVGLQNILDKLRT